MQGYSPRKSVDNATKVGSIDRDQHEAIACREAPLELQTLAALILFSKFFLLRPAEIVQSSPLTIFPVPPLHWESRGWGLSKPLQSGTRQCCGQKPTTPLPAPSKGVSLPESAPASRVSH